MMCEFCEDMMPETPKVADVPGMDVEMYLEPTFNIDTKERKTYLVTSNVRTFEEAVFRINHCPMCGRRLAERGQ